MIKKTAAVFAVVILGILGFAALRPNSFRVARTISVKAPPEKIFPLLNDLRAQTTWSPWEKKDAGMKRVFSGTASGKGSIYEWDGNKDVGHGRMEITEVLPLAKVVMKLDFISPMEAHNMAEFNLEPQAGGTDVTWSIYGPMPYVSKVMTLFCSMDKMIGKEFEAGLADLKALAEKR